MGVSASKDVSVHMSRLPLVKRHDLKYGNQSVQVKSGAIMVVTVPVSKRGAVKTFTLTLKSAKLSNKSATDKMSVQSTLPLSNDELCDAIMLHTGKKPPFEEVMDPIEASTRVLLGTLRDKQEDLLYKVKLTADVNIALCAGPPNRWSKAAGTATVHANIESKLIFDPIVNPEYNPKKTDTVPVTSTDAKTSMSAKSQKLWSTAFNKRKEEAQVPEESNGADVESSTTESSGVAAAEMVRGIKTCTIPPETPRANTRGTPKTGEYRVSESDSGTGVNTPRSGSTASRLQSIRAWAKAALLEKRRKSTSHSHEIEHSDAASTSAAEAEAQADTEVAEFRSKRGHNFDNLYTELPAHQEVEEQIKEEEVEYDPDFAPDPERTFGGSSKTHSLYVLCKS